MNEFLRDLINTKKIRSFIDHVIVRTESKKKYDKLIDEILKRMQENDLYIKPDKYKWKVREVDF